MSLESRIEALEATPFLVRADLDAALGPIKQSMERALLIAEARIVLDQQTLTWKQARSHDWLEWAKDTTRDLCVGMKALFTWPGIIVPAAIAGLLLVRSVPEGYRVQIGTSGITIERVEPAPS